MDPISLYRQQYVENDFERCGLFGLLAESYKISSCLYPGCFIHCTPSFFFPECCYVDSDNRAARFFKSAEVLRFVSRRAIYESPPVIRFHHQDYEKPFPERDGGFDLLMSQYAGFVSAACARYIKIGGILVANNSHGDATMAQLDPRYEFIAAILRRGGKNRLVTGNLEQYFIPKKPLELTKEYLRKTKKGVAYTRPASEYIFKRVE